MVLSSFPSQPNPGVWGQTWPFISYVSVCSVNFSRYFQLNNPLLLHILLLFTYSQKWIITCKDQRWKNSCVSWQRWHGWFNGWVNVIRTVLSDQQIQIRWPELQLEQHDVAPCVKTCCNSLPFITVCYFQTRKMYFLSDSP